jgi:restriction system protein
MTVWTVKGGSQGQREERFLDHHIIGGGWEDLPSLTEIASKEDLDHLYRRSYPEASNKQVSAYVGQLWSLTHRMEQGDLIVVPLKTTGTVAVGRITGPYAHRDDLGEDLRHTRPVDWIATDVPRDAFDQDLLFSFGAYLTIGQVRRDNADARVLAAVERRAVVATHDSEVTPPIAPDGAEEVPDVGLIAREQIRQHISAHFAGHDLARLVGAVLAAQGYTGVDVSAPGADRGVDILAGSGPMGLSSPRLAVQVKTGQADVDVFRALRGVIENFGADQGLLVAWRGFKGTVRSEARQSHFTMRLWDADNLLDELFDTYERLPADLRSELPIKRIWTLVIATE